MDTIFLIVALSTLSPILGSLIGVIKRPSEGFMYMMLSFAAGVMLAISFLELIPESIELSSELICIAGLIVGSAGMHMIDRLIPHVHPDLCDDINGANLKRTSIYLIVGIFMHNFPEGMALALGTVTDTKVSIVIAVAIAIHNIPEGICTAAPYYHCTRDRMRAFLLSSSTAIPILLGFLSAYYLFRSITFEVLGFLVAVTAGLMIFICADELIPSSSRKITNRSTVFPLFAGIIFVILLQSY